MAFEQHYEHTPPLPTVQERALPDPSGFPWSRGGTSVVDAIASSAEAPATVAADLQCVFEACQFGKRAESGCEETEFERSIASRARFLGHRGKEKLTAVFASIDDGGELAAGDGRRPILDVDPAASLKSVYRRACCAQMTNEKMRSAGLTSTTGHRPPAGRMNAWHLRLLRGDRRRDGHRGSPAPGRRGGN